jgi:catechol 2,3-dioxygenase-like lactoylglutathione lyase family enzyme
MAARFNLIGLVVADITRSAAFYRRLGLDIPEGDDHVDIALPGGMRLALDTVDVVKSFEPDWQPPVGGHRIALAFECESPDGVDRTFKELTAAGATAHKEPWDAFWGQRYAVVLDPDGNHVELFASQSPSEGPAAEV